MARAAQAALVPAVAGADRQSATADSMRVVARRYHFNLGGGIYVFTTLLLMTGAINSQNNLLFLAFGLALAGLFISGVLSGGAMMGLRLARLQTASASVGDRLVIRYRVSNRNRFIPAMGLTIEELRPGEGGRFHWGSRVAPHADWAGLVSRPIALCVGVGPRGAEEAAAEVLACRRGEVTFDRVRVRSSFPFGLMGKSVVFAREQRVMVRPVRLPLEDRFLDSLMQGPRGSTSLQSRTRSPGTDEFVGLRHYVPGDPTSQIAWKPSARSLASGGSLIVRRRAAAGSMRLWIVLDLPTPGVPAGPDPRELAIALAAAIIAETARRPATRAAHVGLCVPALGITAPPRPRRLFADFLLDDLARLDTAKIDPAKADLLPPRIGADALVVVHAPGRSGLGRLAARHVSAGHLAGVVAGPVPELTRDPARRGGEGTP